jgi:hypothetical protein
VKAYIQRIGTLAIEAKLVGSCMCVPFKDANRVALA